MIFMAIDKLLSHCSITQNESLIWKIPPVTSRFSWDQFKPFDNEWRQLFCAVILQFGRATSNYSLEMRLRWFAIFHHFFHFSVHVLMNLRQIGHNVFHSDGVPRCVAGPPCLWIEPLAVNLDRKLCPDATENVF